MSESKLSVLTAIETFKYRIYNALKVENYPRKEYLTIESQLNELETSLVKHDVDDVKVASAARVIDMLFKEFTQLRGWNSDNNNLAMDKSSS